MKIFIICSKRFYDRIPPIKSELEAVGHTITLPNSYTDRSMEEKMRTQGAETHAKWKSEMIKQSCTKVAEMDAVLVLNFEKEGMQNYIGGATFLEMYEAWKLGKSIYMYNDIPEGMLRDEISGFSPVLIHGDLSKLT